MNLWHRKFKSFQSPVTRYGFAVICVAVAVGLALSSYYSEFSEVGLVGLARVLLVLAVLLPAWYAGTGPAVVALVLATASYNFFFTEPFYSFAIEWRDLPNFLVFLVWMAGGLSFVIVRRRAETELRTARDRLEREVEQRTQQARLLDQTHDSIFVRDMNDVITYWNHGAQELYGWSAQDAIGKKWRELLGTVFPDAAAKANDALLEGDASCIINGPDRVAQIIDRNHALYSRERTQRELIDINEIIREMVFLLRDTTHRHSISIRSELDPALPATSADRVQLQQVLMNLMLNGIEAMKEESGELNVNSLRTEDGKLLVAVSDSGIGLPEGGPDRIFDAFFTSKPGGTGMGLAISRRIIESHGGHLWASANARRGATFQFTLPIRP